MQTKATILIFRGGGAGGDGYVNIMFSKCKAYAITKTKPVGEFRLKLTALSETNDQFTLVDI